MIYLEQNYKTRLGAAVDLTAHSAKQRWTSGSLADKVVEAIVAPISFPLLVTANYILLKPDTYPTIRITYTETSKQR